LFTMILAWKPKSSKSMMWRAYDKLELPDFDMDENLGEDYFVSGKDLEGNSSLVASREMDAFGTEYAPTIGTKINTDSGSKVSSKVK